MTEDHKELGKIWDALSSKYDSQGRDLGEFPYPSLALPQKDNRILDVGCGAGTHMAMFSGISDHVYGVDISHEMIRYAKRFGHALIGDIRKLPFVENTFDYVFSRVVISCVPDWPLAVAEMARVLKPDGLCIIAGANKYSFLAPVRYFLHMLGMYRLGKTYHISIHSLKKTGEKYGLSFRKDTVRIKEPSSDTMMRNVVYSLLTRLDMILNKVLPWWGGDAVIMFSKISHERDFYGRQRTVI